MREILFRGKRLDNGEWVYGGTFDGGMPAFYLSGIRDGYAWTVHEEIIGNVYDNPELIRRCE